MGDSDPRISEDQARRLWERAAELQAEADRRIEEARKVEGPEEGPPDDGPPAEDEGLGYSLTHVRQAAEDVGINPEFLEMALGEEAILEMEGGGEDRPLDRAATRFLATSGESLEVRREFGFPPRTVWPVLELAFTDDQQGTELLETRGGDPWAGGVAVFESPYSYQRTGTLEYYATVAEVRRFLVRLIPTSGGDGCEVVVHAPLRRSQRVNFWVGSGLSAGGGVLGGLIGIGAAGTILGTGGLAAVPLAAVYWGLTLGGAVGGGGLTRLGYNAIYRYGFRLFQKALDRVLNRIGRDLEREARSRLSPGSDGGPGGDSD